MSISAKQVHDHSAVQDFLKRLFINRDESALSAFKARLARRGFELIDVATDYSPLSDPYEILGIDSSWIDVDRHQGHDFGLEALGGCVLTYGRELSSARYEHTYRVQGEISSSRRMLSEFAYGITCACDQASSNRARIILFDGSFAKMAADLGQDEQGSAELAQGLRRATQKNIVCAWYISLPHTTDLIEEEGGPYAHDADFITQTWHKGWRCAVCSKRDDEMNNFIRVYMHNGFEAACYEVPFSLWREQELVYGIILDQVTKGYGYPVALAEAHAHVVIGEDERERFNSLMRKQPLQIAARESAISYKLLRKKRLLG